jgi:hypothetical protein
MELSASLIKERDVFNNNEFVMEKHFNASLLYSPKDKQLVLLQDYVKLLPSYNNKPLLALGDIHSNNFVGLPTFRFK